MIFQKKGIIKKGRKHYKNTLIKSGKNKSITWDYSEDYSKKWGHEDIGKGAYFSRRNEKGRGRVLISKNGNINKKNVSALYKEVDNSSLSDAMKAKTKIRITAELKKLQYEIKQAKNIGIHYDRFGNRLDRKIYEQTLEAKLVGTRDKNGHFDLNSRFQKMLISSGYSKESFAAEFGFNVSDLDNISGDKDIVEIAGRTFQFKFNYNGEMFEELTVSI